MNILLKLIWAIVFLFLITPIGLLLRLFGIDLLNQQIDLAALVSEYVALVSVGQNFRAHCPFHNERTPSFYVFPERQSWRCFGACATGGDAFSFVMKADNLDFSQVLRQLAVRVGITLPNKRTQDDRNPLYKINESASIFYKTYLTSSTEGENVIEYLANRGISEHSIASFNLGLAPTSWNALISHLSQLGYSEDLMEKLRLRVFTFDTCQGEEAHTILYSMVANQTRDRLNYIFINYHY